MRAIAALSIVSVTLFGLAFSTPVSADICPYDNDPSTPAPTPTPTPAPAPTPTPSPVVSTIPDPHHSAIAGGDRGNGSKLEHGDRLLIQAPSLSDPAGSTCITIDNHSGMVVNGRLQSTPVDYFVPWNTPKEWSAFLSAVSGGADLPNVSITTYCCPPLNNATLCGQSLPPLGSRWLGKPTNGRSGTANDIPQYGAAGDVASFSAAKLLNNPSINKVVVYECSPGPNGVGVWNLSTTDSEGSCTPAPGVCAVNSGSFTSLPVSPDSATLCGNNSIVTNFQGGTTGPWSWQCNGTPNMSLSTTCPDGDIVGPDGSCDAPCSATVSASNQATCGSANGTYTAIPPSDPAELCSSGSASPVGSGNVSNPSLPPYGWSCSGSDGSYVNCGTQSPVGAQNPTCGAGSFSTIDALPTSPCGNGSVLRFVAPGADVPWLAPGDWYWQCQDPTGTYSDAVCWAYGVATCGTANGSTTAGPPNPAFLCFAGTASPVTSSGMTYSWTCGLSSQNTSTTAECSSTTTVSPLASALPPTPVDANGACGSSNGLTMPTAPNNNLCSSGTPSAVSGSDPWTWSCNGTGNGTNSGSCTAYPCLACQGNLTGASDEAYSRTITGQCDVSAKVLWTETDSLTSTPFVTTVSWADSLGAFTQTLQPSNASSLGYCQPCYRQLENASNVQNPVTVIETASGNCPAGVSSGTVIPAGNVSVSQ